MTDNAKILVVDDQMAVALMVVFLLTRAGCNVQAALSADQALRIARTETLDLITLDIKMPGINGFELFKRLKQIPHLKDTPVIFVSGGVSEEDEQRAFELGAVDFIEKPFETTDFIFRIKSHLKPKFQPAPALESEATPA